MTPEELEAAYSNAEESAKDRGLKNKEGGMPDNGFLRKAHEDLKESEDDAKRRKLWGSGGSDPYEPAGGLVEETDYYGEFSFLVWRALQLLLPMFCHYFLYFFLTQSFLIHFVVVLHTDKWQQAYRYLGGYIDCSASWGDGSHDSGDNGGGEGGGGACSRWMMWAAVSWKFCYVHEMVHLSLHIS